MTVWTFLLLPPHWRDSPRRALASSAVRREISLTPASLLHPLIFSSNEESLLFLSSHLICGPPTGLLPWLWILDSTNKSTNLSIRLSTMYLPTYLSVYPSIHLSICLSIYLPIYPSVSLPTYLTSHHSPYIRPILFALHRSLDCYQATGWTTDESCFDNRQGQELFSVLQSVKIGSGIPLASYSVGSGSLSPRIETAKAWSRLFRSIYKQGNEQSYTSTVRIPAWCAQGRFIGLHFIVLTI